MTWLELDDLILEHPKFIRAVSRGGSAVVHLWLGLRAYCGQKLSDGVIPIDMLGEVRGPRQPKQRADALKILAEVGLIEVSDTNIVMHDYLQWSRSREQVLADRERARKRQARARSGGGGGPSGGNNGPGGGGSRRDKRSDRPSDRPRDEHRDDARSNGISHGVTSGCVTMASPSASPSASDPDLKQPARSQDHLARVHVRASDPDIEARLRVRPGLAGLPNEPPRPRHDPAGERFGIERWWPSQEILDWAKAQGLSDAEFDEAVEDARAKLRGPGHLDWWDAKILRFLQSSIGRARTTTPEPKETASQREQAEREISERRRAEVADFVAKHGGPVKVDEAEARAALGKFTGHA